LLRILSLFVVSSILFAYCGYPAFGDNNSVSSKVGNFFQEQPLHEILFPKKLNESGIVRIDVANLGYKNQKGVIDTVYDLYVTAYYSDGWPQIIGFVEGGFDPELSAIDLDGNGTNEVLLKYHVGAHTSAYKIYEITYDGVDEINEIQTDQIISNLDNINLTFNVQKHRYEFIVKNVDELPYSIAHPPNIKYKLTTDTYALQGGKIVLLHEDSKIESESQ
jgi:hypothetical protein